MARNANRRTNRSATLPTVVLPRGSRLFHGTIEDIEDTLRPGGYDRVLWFADIPAVAQLYIPPSGSELYIGSDGIARPSKDPSIQQIQHMIDLHYDYDRVRWGRAGRAESYAIPPGWEDLDPNFEYAKEVERRIEALGYERWRDDGPGRRAYRFRTTLDHVLAPGEIQAGTLCAATTRRDMRLWVKALGEGDLTQVQYHDVEGFDLAREQGLDGVLIDDFAQSEKWGNIGHLSVGLFGPALRDLDIECVPATYEEWDRKASTQAWPHPTKPYFHALLERTRQPNRSLRTLKADLVRIPR